MKAQEYLEQIHVLQTNIEQTMALIESLKEKAQGLKGMNNEGARVQSSSEGDSMQRKVDAYIDKERELEELVLDFELRKIQLTQEIQSLNDVRFVKLLFKKYVEGKTLMRVAKEMHYSYDHAKRLHGWALNEFEHKVLR